MDKLEKALQKARAQREIELNRQVLEQARAESEYNAAHEAMATPPVVSNTLKIDESYLERYHVVAHHTRSKEADIFRILRTKILNVMSQSGFKTLGITSPNYGEGKTTVALNLAVSIALDLKQTVLLIDLDLRKPNVAAYLGIEASLGITDYFTDDIPISQCLLRPSFERMTILPAGHATDNSSEVLGSPKIADLAHELKTRYADRLIIFDLPPALAQDDPIAFLPNVDAVLLVVDDGVTTRDEIKQSLHVLAGTNVIGTVLNNSAERNMSSKLENLKKFLGKIRTNLREPHNYGAK